MGARSRHRMYWLQAVHYSIWLWWIPRSVGAAGREPHVLHVRSFGLARLPPGAFWRSPWSRLSRPVASSFVSVHHTRAVYLSVAPFHGSLQLASLAFLWVRGHDPHRGVVLGVPLDGGQRGSARGRADAGEPTGPLARRRLAFAAQLVTDPLGWFAFPEAHGGRGTTIFVWSELFAWLAESAFYALTAVAPSSVSAIAVSAVANGTSLALGFVVL